MSANPSNAEASAWRAAASLQADPSTPVGFVRLFDMIAFERVVREAVSRAAHDASGFSILRRRDQREMGSYVQAAQSCARRIEGQMVSALGVAEALSAGVEQLDLQHWFDVVLTNQAPEFCTTHFIRIRDLTSASGQETVELQPDLHLPLHAVLAECEAAGANVVRNAAHH